MDEYGYLKDLSINELVNIIQEMIDFEETQEALSILKRKDLAKALELGSDIIKNDMGDDYLQGVVWIVLFYKNEKRMIQVLLEREARIGKTLLDDVINDMVLGYDKLKYLKGTPFAELVKSSYDALSDDEKSKMFWNKYAQFYEMYFELE